MHFTEGIIVAITPNVTRSDGRHRDVPDRPGSRGRRRAPGQANAPAQRTPVPMVAWLMPFVILGTAAAVQLNSGDVQSWSVLAAGFAVLVALAVAGPLGPRTANERYPDACRVALRALFGIMVVFALSCAYLALAGPNDMLGMFAVILPVPAWSLLALLIPLWTDSPVVCMIDPEEGWKRLGGFKMLYSNPEDESLWVAMRWRIWNVTGSGGQYAPNIGHRWGRLVMITFILLILATLALLIATARPRGLLP